MVFVHTDGLHQICGDLAIFKNTAPVTIENFGLRVGGEVRNYGFANLFKVTPRAVYYRQPVTLPTGRLNEFHPEQQ